MWSDAYSNACSDAGVSPREDVAAFTGGTLEIRGNTFDNFKNRLQDNEMQCIVEASSTAPVLSELIVPYNNITSTGAVALANGLGGCLDSVIALDLSYNAIEGEGGAALAEAIAQGHALTRLLLPGNPLGGSCGPSLAAMLKSSRHLLELDLYGTDMDMKALVAVALALMENTSVKSLNLGKPLLSNPDDINYVINHLSNAIARNKSLENLNLSHFGITDSHLEMLLMPLCASNITQLNLKGNQLSQDAGALLARLLERKNTFTVLDASFNRLRDKGAIALAGGVQRHSHLNYLALNNNSMGTPGIKSVVEAVAQSPSLKRLYLWGNDFSDGIAKEIYACKDTLEENLDECDFGLSEVGGEPSVYRK